jgi:hypothetical protein
MHIAKEIGATTSRPTQRPNGKKARPQMHASLVSSPRRHFHASARYGSASPTASASAAETVTDREG